jgi:hypothetical protein
MLTPWLCRPLDPFHDISLRDVLNEREADKAKFMNMTVFWLRAAEVAEILKSEAPDLFHVYTDNIARIDLDYKVDDQMIVIKESDPSLRLNQILDEHKSLPLKLRMKLRALSEPVKWH